ncbi:MAG TPA: flagellar basal body L-ring protein FlgH [Steroidobacteraceae bacterium]|nr:flagellar basal body L-ring protein FlgH [Steroidobacteraceae bacterium]
MIRPTNQRGTRVAPGLAAIALLAGCVAAPHVDNYEATLPEPLPAAQAANGAIFQVGHDVPLFENSVARRIGDTVTINLIENTAAQKSSSTTTAKTTNIDLKGPTLFGRPVTVNGTEVLSAGLDNKTSFDGSGDSQQSNKLQGNVTVTVAQRLTNGNLLVRGQKWIGINQGREFVRIQGVIRPIDILPDNTIPSYKVADATISYGGQGALADVNSQGWLSRFFNSKWNPL